MVKKWMLSAWICALFLFSLSGVALAEGMNVTPQDPSQAAEGFQQMSQDLNELSSGIAPVLAFGGFMIGAVMVILGLIFSKRMAKGGFFLAIASGFVFFLLSDLSSAVEMTKGFFEKIASYF